MKRIMLAACIVSLAACGGDKDDVATDRQQDWESKRQSLVYSFPDNNQQQVPVPSPVVLRFSSPVVDTAPNIVVREVGGAEVDDLQLEWVDGKRGLILTPDDKLKPLTEYVVQIPAVELDKGTAPPRNLSFTTRGLQEGPKSLVAAEDFKVIRTIPDGTNFEVMDFSSFRIQFSQPLDERTVKYGDGPDDTVGLSGPDGVVAAHLLVNGHYVTVDPKEDLTPGVEYNLTFTTGVTSIYGDTLPGGGFGNPDGTLALSLPVTPQDTTSPTTGERAMMMQNIADTGALSPLTGNPINMVPMAAVLLGEETATQTSGTLAAELAFVPNFPDQTPFRVKRGSLIDGASIEVLVGGEVPAGFDSGKIRLDFLSDATGYLLPNPYSNADDAPRQVRLFMDVAVSTEGAQANGAITQDLLHIELVGTSIVEDGYMVINAIGVVEPKVLGVERGQGTLSLYLRQVDNGVAMPAPAPLTLASWSHEAELPAPGQPIVLYFNRPVSNETLASVTLTENTLATTTPVPASVHRDGSALIIRPEQPLRRPRLENGQLDDVSYQLNVGGEINLTETIRFDVFMVGIDDWKMYEFNDAGDPPIVTDVEDRLDVDQVVKRSPVLLMSYPGFPCAVDASVRDIENNIAGRCDGALRDQYTNVTGDRVAPPDDLLPIQTLPANDSLAVQVTRDIDPNSVVLGQTFLVEKLTEQGLYASNVDGNIVVRGARITFTPDEPWELGALYRYVVKSNGDDLVAANTTLCDGTQSVCGVGGLPLQTKLYDAEVSMDKGGRLAQTPADSQAGGPDLEILFRGGAATPHVWLPLAAESRDVNANFLLDRDTVLPSTPVNGYKPSSVLVTNYREYSGAEEGADPGNLEPDPMPQDPGGVKPVPNSAKLLSNTPWVPGNAFPGPQINGLSVGCGYQYIPGTTDMQPLECPADKFTYLHSALAAKVTGEYVDGKGIKVLVWPGQILGSSVSVTTLVLNGLAIEIDSGLQLMRMRYAKDDPQCEDTLAAPCRRSKPIEGYISEGPDGPVMNIEVELYIDAAALSTGIGFIGLGSTLYHNLISLPASLTLKGGVTFLDDGRIMVDQISQNALELDFKIESDSSLFRNAGTFQLIVPEGGTFLRYVGDLTK